ncbi:hypothetical protein HanRHA438_Chr04g0151321 [Helianthus annuus]|nr:hypothetical protein HanRHA438_Chr04g0151321 [Helianthus annuus]
MSEPFNKFLRRRIPLTNKYARLRSSTKFKPEFSCSHKKRTFVRRFSLITITISFFVKLRNRSVAKSKNPKKQQYNIVIRLLGPIPIH